MAGDGKNGMHCATSSYVLYDLHVRASMALDFGT